MIRDKLYPNLNLEEEDWRRSMLELVRGLREDTYDKINEPVSRFRATRGTAQSIPDTTWTKVQYNIEDFDNLGEYAHGTDYRFTAQKAGYYQVNAAMLFVSTTLGAKTLCIFELYRNGSAVSRLELKYYPSGDHTMSLAGSDMIYLAAGQYIEIFAYQNSGGAINTDANTARNFFSVHRQS